MTTPARHRTLLTQLVALAAVLALLVVGALGASSYANAGSSTSADLQLANHVISIGSVMEAGAIDPSSNTDNYADWSDKPVSVATPSADATQPDSDQPDASDIATREFDGVYPLRGTWRAMIKVTDTRGNFVRYDSVSARIENCTATAVTHSGMLLTAGRCGEDREVGLQALLTQNKGQVGERTVLSLVSYDAEIQLFGRDSHWVGASQLDLLPSEDGNLALLKLDDDYVTFPPITVSHDSSWRGQRVNVIGYSSEVPTQQQRNNDSIVGYPNDDRGQVSVVPAQITATQPIGNVVMDQLSVHLPTGMDGAPVLNLSGDLIGIVGFSSNKVTAASYVVRLDKVRWFLVRNGVLPSPAEELLRSDLEDANAANKALQRDVDRLEGLVPIGFVIAAFALIGLALYFANRQLTVDTTIEELVKSNNENSKTLVEHTSILAEHNHDDRYAQQIHWHDPDAGMATEEEDQHDGVIDDDRPPRDPGEVVT